MNNKDEYFVYVRMAYFHFITDTLAPIILEHSKNPNRHFVLINDEYSKWEQYTHPYFLIQFLDYYKIRYTIFDEYLNIDDTSEGHLTLDTAIGAFNELPIETFHKYLSPFVDTKIIPFRKVYLTRKGITDNMVLEENNNMYQDHFRVDDESKLEKYFISKNFEILRPENFKNFEEQIKYFYETKILVGLNGAGLTNMLFMQKNQFVIDLLPEVQTPSNQKIYPKLCSFYFTFSWLCEHYYLMVPHKRISSSLIQKIDMFLESNFYDISI